MGVVTMAHLARAVPNGGRRELLILRPGDLAWWNPVNSTDWVPVTVLGYGEYVSAFGNLIEAVTVRVNATRGGVVRGQVLIVGEHDVCPRRNRTWHRKGGYFYPSGVWAFDLRCAVHGEVHSAPSYVCRKGDR